MFFAEAKRIGVWFVVGVLGVSVAQAQSVKQYLKKGEEYERAADYYAAGEIYKQAIEKFPDNIDFKYRYAENCRFYNDYINAATAYKNVVTDDREKVYPQAQFWQALMLKQQAKYDAALKLLERFQLKYKTNDEYAVRVKHEIASCKWAMANKKRSKTRIVHLQEPINSVYSDFNPFTDSTGELFYSSMRDAQNRFLSRIYRADSSRKKADFPWEKADTKKHIANGFYNPTFDEFYCTLCEDESQKRCAVYMSALGTNWLPLQKLKNINVDSFSTTHPHLIRQNNEEYLLFSSNRPGGKGGYDLYKAKRTGENTFGTPENLVAINTSGDEFTPFFDADSNKLFFASDGLYGFGGLDIFSIPFQSFSTEGSPENMGYGINSEANDFNYAIASDRSKAYFSSNREGSLYIKALTCCYDLWYYDIEKPELKEEEKKDSSEVSRSPSSPKISDKDTNSITQLPTPPKVKTPTISTEFPITLYFHNDEPECCNTRDTTSLNYMETYQHYWRQLSDYKRGFTHGLAADEKITAEAAVFSLFTNKVARGAQQLISFSSQLLEILQAGKKVTLTVQGYCSPLNYNEYNIHLANRRIASVKNYFYQYRSGMLQAFIDNGSLVFINEPLGEETTASTVSDLRDDRRNSVYNPLAAQERRVEILSVLVE